MEQGAEKQQIAILRPFLTAQIERRKRKVKQMEMLAYCSMLCAVLQGM